MFMFILFIFDMEEEFNEFIGGIPALFMPGIEDIPFIWDRAPFIFTEDPKLFCISSCSCDFIIEPPIGGWQGFPSLTNTGTATLLGEGRGFKSSPFSCLARFSLYLWFWNQIFTCTGVSRIMLARCSLSGAERYLWVWALENRTRLFRFFWLSGFWEEFPSPFSLLPSHWTSLFVSDFTNVFELFIVEWLSVLETSLEWLELPGEFRCPSSTIAKGRTIFKLNENSI